MRPNTSQGDASSALHSRKTCISSAACYTEIKKLKSMAETAGYFAIDLFTGEKDLSSSLKDEVV